MKILILLLTIIILSGCSTMSSYFRKGAELNDDALKAAEAVICKGASVGSIMRRYNTEAKAKAWKELCSKDNSLASDILSN